MKSPEKILKKTVFDAVKSKNITTLSSTLMFGGVLGTVSALALSVSPIAPLAAIAIGGSVLFSDMWYVTSGKFSVVNKNEDHQKLIKSLEQNAPLEEILGLLKMTDPSPSEYHLICLAHAKGRWDVVDLLVPVISLNATLGTLGRDCMMGVPGAQKALSKAWLSRPKAERKEEKNMLARILSQVVLNNDQEGVNRLSGVFQKGVNAIDYLHIPCKGDNIDMFNCLLQYKKRRFPSDRHALAALVEWSKSKDMADALLSAGAKTWGLEKGLMKASIRGDMEMVAFFYPKTNAEKVLLDMEKTGFLEEEIQCLRFFVKSSQDKKELTKNLEPQKNQKTKHTRKM